NYPGSGYGGPSGPSDPLGPGGGYGDPAGPPNAPQQPGGGYGQGGSGYYGPEQSYGSQPSSQSPDSTDPYGSRDQQQRPPEDWDSYRGDFRR
ncbi:MAG: hypothetical protein ACRDOO_10650, partial [Actinomadura sp.]